MAEKTIKEEKVEKPLEAFASVNEYQQLYFDLNYPSGMNTFATYTIPSDQKEMIKKAKELREYDIVDYFLRLRCDYALPIKGVKCAKPGQQRFYDKHVLPLVQDFARQFEYENWSISEVFAHYGFKNDDKTPMYLVSEDPENITPNSALGIESYEIKISNTLKQQLRKLKEQNQLDKLPEYLRKAISEKGVVKDKIILNNENMYRACNQKADYKLRPKPMLLKIGKSLILREFLIDLDYINSFASQKTNLVHIKCGTDKETIKNWDSDKIKAIHDLVTNRAPGQAFITTRGDVSINSVEIDLAAMFDPKKFEECNKRILNFFGVSAVFMPSESGGINNSTVIVSLKQFEESIKADRRTFEKFLKVYFGEINKRNGFGEIPEIQYKHTNIRGNDELIKEMQFLKESGVLSFEKICLEFDYDYDEIKAEKQNDWDNRDWQAQTYENSQGLQPLLKDAVDQKIKIGKETKQETSITPKKKAGEDSG